MKRLGALLRRFADRLDPLEEPYEEERSESPIQYVMELQHGTKELSRPLDAHALWREHVYDTQFYIEENDVYRTPGHFGTYL